jgi:hypothetical protein
MSASVDPVFPEDGEDFRLWQDKVAGTNISAQTLLATDYLNHFNEIVMLIDMVADMSDLIADCKDWQPRSYQDHFRDSGFSDRALAIEAYDHVPSRFREPFEETVAQLNRLVAEAVHRIEDAINLNDPELVAARCHAASRGLQRLMDVANAVIHGSAKTMAQGEIDDLLAI